MNRGEVKQILTYAAAGAISIAAAFAISLKYITHSRAQEPTAPQGQEPAQSQQEPGAHFRTGPPNGAQNPNGAAPDAAGNPSSGDSAVTELEGFLEPFIYDVVNRRDPFQAYVEYVPQDLSAPARPLSPAQRYDLDQLKLIGIMWDVKDPKAMFLDPDSEVIVLGRDEGIGNKNGYIASIREGEVVVVEAMRKRGDIFYKTRILRMER